MKKEKITFGAGYRILKFIQGLILGFLSMIPFMDIERLRELFSDDNIHDSFEKRMRGYLNRNATEMIGLVLGMLGFFYIPLITLTTILGKPIYLSLMALSFFFVVTDLYLAFRKNDIEFYSPSKVVKMALLFLIGFSVPFLLRLLPFSSVFDASLTSKDGILWIALLMAVIGFLGEFSGFSAGSVFAMTSSFLSLEGNLFDVVRGKDIKSHLLFLLAFIVFYIAGANIGYTVKAKGGNEKERSMMNLGLMVSSLYLFYANDYSNASFELKFEDEAVTKDMKLVVMLTLLVLGLVIGGVISAHCYRFINRRETKLEKKENPDYLKETLTKDLEVQDRRSL